MLDLQAHLDELIVPFAADFSALVLQELEDGGDDVVGGEIAAELHRECVEVALDVMLCGLFLCVALYCLHDALYYCGQVLDLHCFQ